MPTSVHPKCPLPYLRGKYFSPGQDSAGFQPNKRHGHISCALACPEYGSYPIGNPTQARALYQAPFHRATMLECLLFIRQPIPSSKQQRALFSCKLTDFWTLKSAPRLECQGEHCTLASAQNSSRPGRRSPNSHRIFVLFGEKPACVALSPVNMEPDRGPFERKMVFQDPPPVRFHVGNWWEGKGSIYRSSLSSL